MKVALCLALCAVALARIPSRNWEEEHFRRERSELKETSFKRGSEYEFQYNGQVATGIPGSSPQHAATRIQALVSLVLKGEDKAILKIQQVRMGRLNQQLYNPRAMVPFMAFQEVELQEEAAQELRLPVMFTYESGVVSDLVFDGQERPWSANIKKGILNMLQVNLQKRNQVRVGEEAQLLNRMPQQERDEAQDFYATQEKTVEGECETLYTIVSDPSYRNQDAQVLNVTRSIEFENCKQRPEIKYNFRFQDPCESCEPKYEEDQKFLKSSSIAKFNISGTRQEFLIESAMVESQYQVVPFNREANLISTYVNQTLVLQRAGPIQSGNVKQPKNPQQSDSDLMYSLDWDKDMEEFLMKGHNQARLPVDIKDRINILSNILRPLVSEIRDCVSEEAPIQYARLIKLLRFTEKSQLPQVFDHFVHQQPQGFSQEEHLKIKAILTDALADAATKDSISFLLNLIKEEKISPLRASLTIKHLNNIRTPSKEIVREFMSFLQTPVVQQNFVLKQAAYLTLGSIVQGLCMPSEERLAILPRPSSDKLPRRLGPNTHLCPVQLQDQLLEKMFEMVKAEQSEEEQMEEAVLALKTISNMGIPKAIMELEKIIKSDEQEYPEMIRIEAIMALRQLRETLPQKIQQILMPIYMSRQESNEVRMAAVHQILETLPSRPILEQVARTTFQDRSQQVAAFVYTYMSTVANSTNPCEQTFARDLKLALRHGRVIPKAFRPHLSKFIHASAYSKVFRLGGDASFTSVISNRTMVPRFLGFNIHASALGFWSKYLVSVGISQENIESILARALRRTDLDDISLDDLLNRSPRAQQSPVKELKKLWKQLKTQARHIPEGAKGLAFLKLKDQEFFMAPITQHSLRKLPSLQALRRELEQGKNFNLHKAAQLHEVQYKIPTTIGMPLVASVKIPTVAQLTGQVRLETKNPFKVHFNNIKPSVAISVITTVNIWNPVVASGLKVVANAKVCAPMTGKAVLELKGRQPSLRLSMEPVEKEIEWVKLETRPMTFTRTYRFPLTAYPKAQYKTIVNEQWNRVNQVRDYPVVRKAEQMIQKVIGMQVRVEGQWHHVPMNAPAYLPVCPFSGPNYFSLKSQPGQEQPKEFVLKLQAQMEPRRSLRSEQYEMEEEEIQQEEYETDKAFQTLIKAQVYTKGGPQERKAEMETRISFAPNLRILNSEMKAHIQPIPNVLPRKVQICTQARIQYPQAPTSFSQLRGKAVSGKFEATWGQEECKEQNKVEIVMAAKHSQRQQELWSQDPELAYYAEEEQQEEEPERFSPVNLQEPLHRQQNLFQYTLQAQYNNICPEIKNITNGLFRALKTYYYWNTNEVNFNLKNKDGQIKALLTIDPRTQQFFNLTVKTPVQNVTFQDAELPMPLLTPISLRRSQQNIEEPMDILENFVSGSLQTCRLNARRVKTFDGAEIRAPLSTCWTVLAKDCDHSENPAFAVLARKMDQESQQKAVKVITNQFTVVVQPESPAYDSLKVKVNGKVLSEDKFPQNDKIEIQQMNGQQIQVYLKKVGVRVQFDGYSAKVQVTPIVASAQCGICGHQNYDSFDEFRTPQNERVQDIRRFIKSYTVKDGKCQYPKQLSDISASQELEYEPRWEQEDNYQDSQESQSQEQDFDQTFNPSQRTLVDEEGSKVCFSVEPVPICPHDSFPVRFEEEEKEVQFRCISRRHPQVHRFIRLARNEYELPQDMQETLQQHQPQYTQQYPVPAKCEV